jgi:hypothetical protein
MESAEAGDTPSSLVKLSRRFQLRHCQPFVLLVSPNQPSGFTLKSELSHSRQIFAHTASLLPFPSVTPTGQLCPFYHYLTFLLQFNIMEATIVSGQGLNTDAQIIRQLDDDFARMSNLVARNQLAANNATGQALQIQDLVNEKQAICEILRRIALLEEDFNTGRLEREGAAARGM